MKLVMILIAAGVVFIHPGIVEQIAHAVTAHTPPLLHQILVEDGRSLRTLADTFTGNWS